MFKKLHDQQGFAVIEALLILLVVAIIGGTGFYVWHANKNSSDTFSAAAKVADSSPEAKTKAVKVNDETSGWVSYTGSAISFKYPKAWTEKVCQTDTVLMSSSDSYSGNCNSDSTAQMFVNVFDDSIGPAPALTAPDYTGLQSQTVKIGSVSGMKQSGTFNPASEQFIGPPKGTKTVLYVFKKGGKTISLNYTQEPGWSDVSTDFNTLVNKTLKLK
jgi:hypothetical protein